MIVPTCTSSTHLLTPVKSYLRNWKKTRFFNSARSRHNLTELNCLYLKRVVQLCDRGVSSSRTLTLLSNMPLSHTATYYPVERLLGSNLRKALLWDSLTWLVWASCYYFNLQHFSTSYLLVLNLKTVLPPASPSHHRTRRIGPSASCAYFVCVDPIQFL